MFLQLLGCRVVRPACKPPAMPVNQKNQFLMLDLPEIKAETLHLISYEGIKNGFMKFSNDTFV